MQTEVFFLINLLRLDDPADETLNLWNKPNEDECVDYIEAGVEGCQYETELGGIGHEGGDTSGFLGHIDIVTHETAHHIDEGTEDE